MCVDGYGLRIRTCLRIHNRGLGGGLGRIVFPQFHWRQGNGFPPLPRFTAPRQSGWWASLCWWMRWWGKLHEAHCLLL